MNTKKLNLFGILLSLLFVLNACSGDDNETQQTLIFEIGQEYQGGIIFYLDDSAQHGLIAYRSDIGMGNWGCFYNDGSVPDFKPPTTPIAQNNGIGFGLQNTLAILNFCDDPDIAAKLATKLNASGYDDWYVPSIDELQLIYENRDLIGGFPDLNNDFDLGELFTYASSSEGFETKDGNGGFYYLNYQVFDFSVNPVFSYTRNLYTSKSSSASVRPIRSF